MDQQKLDHEGVKSLAFWIVMALATLGLLAAAMANGYAAAS